MKLKKKDTVTALALTAALLACGGFPAACKKAPPSAAIPAAKTPADQKAVEWDYEQITVAELRPVKLYDVFDEARSALAIGNSKAAARHVEAAAGFFDREAKTRTSDAQEAFVGYGEQLHRLAARLDSNTPTTETELDQAFARSHSALAIEYASTAKSALAAGDRRGVGQAMHAAMQHSENALKWAGARASEELSEEAKELRAVAGTLEAGAEVEEEKAEAAVKKTWDYARDAVDRVAAFGKASAAKLEGAAKSGAEEAKTAISKGAAATADTIRDVAGKAAEKTGEALEKAGEKLKDAGKDFEAQPAPAPPVSD